MKNLNFANIAVFLLFFGAALIQSLQKGNWVEAIIFLALGFLSLWADFRKPR